MADRILQVGVKAVIENDHGEVLLLRRSAPWASEQTASWDIPGGRIKIGESLEAALRRELQEETGLTLNRIERVFHAQDILANPKLHVVRITFLIKTTGTVELSEEHDDHRWVPRAELPLEPTDPFFVAALQANDWIK